MTWNTRDPLNNITLNHLKIKNRNLSVTESWIHLHLAVAQLYVAPVLWLCFTWIHGHLSFSAAVQALTSPFLLSLAKYGYHFCRPKRARWVEEAVICWLEIIPPSMPSGPEHSERTERQREEAIDESSYHSNTQKCGKVSFRNAYNIKKKNNTKPLTLSSPFCFVSLFLSLNVELESSLWIPLSGPIPHWFTIDYWAYWKITI